MTDIKAIGETFKKCIGDMADAIRDRYLKLFGLHLEVAKELAQYVKIAELIETAQMHNYTGQTSNVEEIIYNYVMNSIYSILTYMDCDQDGKRVDDSKAEYIIGDCLEHDFDMPSYGMMKGLTVIFKIIEMRTLSESIKADVRVLLDLPAGNFTILPTLLRCVDGKCMCYVSGDLCPKLRLLLESIELPAAPDFVQLGIPAAKIASIRNLLAC